MRTPLALLALACSALLAAAPAAAQSGAPPRSIADCEKIKGDLAYNQCLASFGPKRGERAPRGAQPTPEQLQSAAPEAEPRQAGRRGRRGGRAVAARGGRQSASFDIIAGGSSYGRSGYGRQRVGRPRLSRRYGGGRRSYRRRR